MSDEPATTSIPLRVGLGAIAWGLILLLAWAIHPVATVARFAPVENPTPAQQASIDRFVGDSTDPDFVLRFDCSSTPLQAATGTADPLEFPVLDDGFVYLENPCTPAYESARAAVWVNVVAIGVALAGCVALHVRGIGRRPGDREPDSADETSATR